MPRLVPKQQSDFADWNRAHDDAVSAIDSAIIDIDRSIRQIPAISASAFWANVDQSGGPQSCWPWLGGRSGFGHGRVKIAGKLYSPHRVAWTLENGPIEPDGSYHGPVVRHSCDNPICCNPKHLEIGTQKQNARDMAARGRSNKGRRLAPTVAS